MGEKLNVKKGDKVILCCGLRDKRVAIVDNVTPKGFIKVNGALYYDDGRKRGGSCLWEINFIKKYTEEEGRKIREDMFIRSIRDKLRNIDKLTYEQAVAINKIFENGE